MISAVVVSNNEPYVHDMCEYLECTMGIKKIIVVNDRDRKGKGWAVRYGMQEVTSEYCLIIDGDMDIHPWEMRKLWPHMIEYDVIIGTKNLNDMPFRRKVLSFGYRKIIKALFRLNITDTQTGIKLWRTSCFPDFKTDGFAYDIEVLAKAVRSGCRIKEVPIKADVYKNLKGKSVWRIFKETIAVRLALLSLNAKART